MSIHTIHGSVKTIGGLSAEELAAVQASVQGDSNYIQVPHFDSGKGKRCIHMMLRCMVRAVEFQAPEQLAEQVAEQVQGAPS